MPPLKNHKHELFAQMIFQGVHHNEAYVKLGYSHNDGNACNLKKSTKIAARIAELEEIAATAAGLSKSWVISSLIDMAVMHQRDNPSAAAKCLELLGKTDGLELFTDKSKNQNIPQTIEDLLAIAEKLPQAEKDKLRSLGKSFPEPEPLKVVNIKG